MRPVRPAAEEILGSEAHHGVGALLEVAAADVDVDYGRDGAVIRHRPAVMERDFAACRLQRQIAQPLGEAAGRDRDAPEAGGNRDAVGNRAAALPSSQE